MLHQGTLPAVACVLLALGAVAAGALGASESGEPADAVDPSSPAMRRAFEQGEQQMREAEAYRNSSAGRADRADSQDAFVDQPDDRALATAREEFPGLVSSPPLQWPRLSASQEIDHYLSPNRAVVDLPGTREAVLESDLPLRGETPGGDRAPLDMGLTDRGDSFEPKSSTTAVELPKSSSDAVRFPDQDLGLQVAGAGATDAKLTQNKVFFANALTDTDVVVEPTPGGAEVSLLLRSPESPENPALRFDLPAGADLRLADAPNTAEVVRDGKRLALVNPATAVDAQGKSIAVTYRVEGDRLVLDLGDTSDVAWPVMVDPTTNVYDNNGQSVGQGATGFTWPGWQQISSRTQSNPCPYPYGAAFYECKQLDGSLTIWGFVGVQPPYVAFDYGAFRKPARSGTYIYSFHAANMSHTSSQSISFGGVCSTNCAAWMPGHWWTPLDKSTNVPRSGPDAMRTNPTSYAGQTDYYCYDPTGAAPSTSCPLSTTANAPGLQVNTAAEWGMLMTGTAPTAQPHAAMGGAATLSADNKPPLIVSATHSNLPSSGWVANYTDTVTLRVADNNGEINNTYTYGSNTNIYGDHLTGVGLGTVAVAGPGAGGSQSAGCSTTTNYDSCPQVLTFPGITYTAPEGTSAYTPSSTDIVGNSQNGTGWTVKVDRTPPTGSFTNVPTYTNGTASITGTISDSLSGPQDAKVQYQAPNTTTWVDACARQATTSSFSCNWTPPAGDGTYKVRAELRDSVLTTGGGPNVGYTATADVIVDRTVPTLTNMAPAVGSQGVSDRFDDNNLTEARFVQQDERSGVVQTTLEYNTAIDGSETGAWVSADAQPAVGAGETSTLWESSEIADGLHMIRASTTDRAGNVAIKKYQVVAATGRTIPCGSGGTCFAGLGYGVATQRGPSIPPPPACSKYVSPNGDDSNNGTFALPFKSLKRLWQSLSATAAVGCVREASNGAPVEIPDSDNAGNNNNGRLDNNTGVTLTLRSAPNESGKLKGRLWLYGDNITVRDLKLDGRNRDHRIASECDDYGPAVPCPNVSPLVQGNNDALLNNDITSRADIDPCSWTSAASQDPATSACNDVLDPDNPSNLHAAEDADRLSTHTICVNLTDRDGVNAPDNVVITGNYIHDCGVPWYRNEASGGHWHGIYVSSATNTKITYNTFWHNGDRAIQLNPNAQDSFVDHNTIVDNGFGIQVGGEDNNWACGVSNPKCSSGNTIQNNIVTASRAGTGLKADPKHAGADLRYAAENPGNTVYNLYARTGQRDEYGLSNKALKNCVWQGPGFDGVTVGTDTPPGRGHQAGVSTKIQQPDRYPYQERGIDFRSNTVRDPLLYRLPNTNKWVPRRPDCFQYGAFPQTFKAFGLRDNLTTPVFQPGVTGTGPSLWHTYVIAARIRDAAHPPLETGVTNKAKCKPALSTKWRVYAKFRNSSGGVEWRCGAALAPNTRGFFAAMLTNASSDRVVMPGHKTMILGLKQYNVPRNGVSVDALAITDKQGKELGGVWSGIQYLGSKWFQGTTDWRTPTLANTFEWSSFDQGYTYKATGTDPSVGFCALGPNKTQAGTC